MIIIKGVDNNKNVNTVNVEKKEHFFLNIESAKSIILTYQENDPNDQENDPNDQENDPNDQENDPNDQENNFIMTASIELLNFDPAGNLIAPEEEKEEVELLNFDPAGNSIAPEEEKEETEEDTEENEQNKNN